MRLKRFRFSIEASRLVSSVLLISGHLQLEWEYLLLRKKNKARPTYIMGGANSRVLASPIYLILCCKQRDKASPSLSLLLISLIHLTI
jgi:hypothetical protein